MIKKLFLCLLILMALVSAASATLYEFSYPGPWTGPGGLTTASAFDHNTSTYWDWDAATTATLGMDYGAGNTHAINCYCVTSDYIYPVSQYAPTAWTVQGSDDNTSWSTLDTKSGISWTSQKQTQNFSFANTHAYRSYKWVITANTGTDVIAYEWNLFSTNPENTIPVASFTSTNISVATNTTGQSWAGHSPFIMQFNDTSTNTPTYWNSSIQGYGTNTTHLVNWSQARNATAEFTVGNFTVSWGAGNNIGYNQTTSLLWVNVTGVPPTSAFTANVTSGVNPLPVAFNDTSTNSPTMYNASFGDGLWLNQTSFPASNITHLYSTAGSYTVTWYVSNAYGTGSSTATITVYGAANSLFSALSTAGNAPFTTIFSDLSTNTTPGTDTYFWVFGDGNTSSAQNPVYTYNISGTYEVDHKFNNGLSISWNNKTAYIVVGTAAIAPVASFYGGPQLGVPPLTVYLTDVSTNTPTMWNYSWGDGTWGNGTANPSHTYTISGWFTANETVSNSAGSNTTSKSNFIGVY